MKKLAILSLSLLSATSAFADYYDEELYSHSIGSSLSSISSLSAILGWSLFIYIVAVIIGIILFVKVWKMTGDVKSIKKTLQGGASDSVKELSRDDLAKRVRALYFTSDTEGAYGLLNSYLFARLSNLDKAEKVGEVLSVENGWDYEKGGVLYLPVDKFIKTIISEVEYLYALIGREIPSDLKNMTYESYSAFIRKDKR